MAKTQDKEQKNQEQKHQEQKHQEQKHQEKEKDQKRKDRKALVGRVMKMVKKSRRKLGEAKFEKELQRTIAFLEQLQATLGNSHAKNSNASHKMVEKPAKKPASKPNSVGTKPVALKPVVSKPAIKAAKKVVSSVKK
jgi:hypothetical protein